MNIYLNDTHCVRVLSKPIVIHIAIKTDWAEIYTIKF